jgi:hypothetical protein
MLNKDFREFAELLNSTGVEYMVVGGYALAAHGHPRYTGDIDLWIRQTPANVANLLKALDLFGFGTVGLTEADFMAPESVIQLGYPPARIDLLTAIDGVDFEACRLRQIVVDISGVQLPVIHVDDFRANKRAAGRAKDIADLESLDDTEPRP